MCMQGLVQQQQQQTWPLPIAGTPARPALAQSPATPSSSAAARGVSPSAALQTPESGLSYGAQGTPQPGMTLTPSGARGMVVPDSQLQRVHAAMTRQRELLCCAKQALAALERSGGVAAGLLQN